MLIPVTLLKFDTKALNEEENTVSKQVVEKYLSSDRWKQAKQDRNVLCGITHSLRNEPGSEEGLGASDKLFKDGVIVGCLNDSWVSKDGKSWEGEIDVFDDLSLYSEEQKSQIMQLLRLIKNHVNVQVSCCIMGEWDDADGSLKYLYNLEGVDFTLNGAFQGSKIHMED